MEKRMISSFNRKEKEAREKYGQVEFLKKYIKKYKSYTGIMKWLFPIVVIISLVLVGISLGTYISSDKTSDLVILIIWSLAAIIWIVVTTIHFTFQFDFIDNKLMNWKKELSAIEELEDDNNF
ncbi:MAG: hypothetical protein PF513_06480 [Tenericutes bacterium]|jgi:hypothetical protein|nr:hypothetical protein [Mycoplasmatota bacterium]